MNNQYTLMLHCNGIFFIIVAYCYYCRLRYCSSGCCSTSSGGI